jgi:hypothetical protein
MKFPKLHLACANDELRPTMECICIDKEFTFASDAHILVRHRTSEIFKDDFVESLPKQSIMVNRKAVKLICEKATVKISLTDDKKQIQLHRLDGSIISYKLYNDGNYPDANKIIPDLKDMKPVDKIGINSTLLDRLADGLGCSIPILHLNFFDQSHAIYVTSPYSDYEFAIGIIMPVNINL